MQCTKIKLSLNIFTNEKKKKKIGHSSTIDVSRENMNKKYVELNIVICVSIGQFCDIVRLNNYFE